MNSSTKLTLGVVLMILIVGTMAATANATSPETQDRTRQRDQLSDTTQCQNFVDEDGDGICDNCPGDCPGGGGHYQHRHGGRS